MRVAARRVLDGSAVVAIPAKDEADYIGACLLALARQQGAYPDAVLLLINDTADESVLVARSLAPRLPFALHIVEHEFPAALACAGQARRMAMEHAAALLGDAGVLLTTDADARVAPNWLALNLAYILDGVEAVAGCVALDPADAKLIPVRLHADDASECAYAAVLDEIAALIDPDPWDPMPRHAECPGASICVTLDAYRRAGGMPGVALGEDRSFYAALRQVDARIRHAPEVQVTVSGRTLGRAPGGMADTIRRRLVRADPWLDDALEPAVVAVRRAQMRRRVRRAYADQGVGADDGRLASELGVAAETVAAALSAPYFGEAWAALEQASPALTRFRVAVADLPAEMAQALRERDALRRRERGAALLPGLAATPA